MKSCFYKSLIEKIKLYDACGNRIGVVSLRAAGYKKEYDFSQDVSLRSFFCEWAKYTDCDSIMVITGNPKKREHQGYHCKMYVFEPNGNDDSKLPGGFSTMCGNGIRAVADYIKQILPEDKTIEIMTGSGLRKVLFKRNDYKVNMGKFYSDPSILSKYVNRNYIKPTKNNCINMPIPEEIRKSISKFISTKTWSIGLNGNIDANGEVDGEPHVVLFMPQNSMSNMQELQELAKRIGPLITKNYRIFPNEINANFVICPNKVNTKARQICVMQCTHERNLGDNPEHSVTKACGTGATVGGGLVFRKLRLKDNQMIKIKCPGGILKINRDQDMFYMSGNTKLIDYKINSFEFINNKVK